MQAVAELEDVIGIVESEELGLTISIHGALKVQGLRIDDREAFIVPGIINRPAHDDPVRFKAASGKKAFYLHLSVGVRTVEDASNGAGDLDLGYEKLWVLFYGKKLELHADVGRGDAVFADYVDLTRLGGAGGKDREKKGAEEFHGFLVVVRGYRGQRGAF